MIGDMQLPSVVIMPDIHDLILEIFDVFIAPTFSSSTELQSQIKIFITRKLLSNNVRQILAQFTSTTLSTDQLTQLVLYSFQITGIVV